MTPATDLDAQKLTESTRVIVSFGAREGGFELTAQLRLDIMDRYGKRRVVRDPAGKWLRTEADDAFCYLDAITLKDASGTSYDQLKLKKKVNGVEREVAVDLNKMANPYWNTYYPAAVGNAAVMIFQITTPWLESEYCLEEFGWFIMQGLKNMEAGKEIACIFMVFPEAEAKFSQLLGQLKIGLATGIPSQCMAGNQYKRMLEGFKALDASQAQAQAAQAQARLAVQRGMLERLFMQMGSRILPVREAFDQLSFTDYYDAQEQRIALDAQGTAPTQAAYEHQFSYKYGVVEDFQKRLFALLDADLAKAGIHPVPA
jgi:hypothetical protein